MALILAASQDFVAKDPLVKRLERFGHQVVLAATIVDAQDWLKERSMPPDLVIVDVGLRTFGGKEFIQMLKESETWREIPILVQTQSQRCEVFEHCEGILRKPYSLHELTTSIQMLLKE